ncbi:asparagine synthase [Crassaminicella thermophila]|uniref:Asparagine synthase n=1 Tax=Crassaminicella thermophila TaxID=2599308 RepID=A0A5C0SFQ0_CRATE|nr:asparagine synthase [Crassaminicella thermophila]QEK13313.1 asparagine synthase [Crassaminicella thermophila]
MKVREGLIPTALGSAVTITGAIMKKRDVAPMIAAGIVGFGLAHVFLGTVDMVQHNHHR